MVAARARRRALQRGLARPGDRVVVTAGVPFDVPGHDQPDEGRDGVTRVAGWSRPRAADLPRHRHELRRAADRLSLRRSAAHRTRATSARASAPWSRRDGGTRLLIDTPPELRLQLVAGGIDRVDAVLFTHDHADHMHGIDDLRAITVRRDAPLPMYGSADTLERIAKQVPLHLRRRHAPAARHVEAGGPRTSRRRRDVARSATST